MEAVENLVVARTAVAAVDFLVAEVMALALQAEVYHS